MKSMVVSLGGFRHDQLSNVLPSPLQKSFLSAMTLKAPANKAPMYLSVSECLDSTHVCVLSACLGPQGSKEGIMSTGTGVME